MKQQQTNELQIHQHKTNHLQSPNQDYRMQHNQLQFQNKNSIFPGLSTFMSTNSKHPLIISSHTTLVGFNNPDNYDYYIKKQDYNLNHLKNLQKSADKGKQQPLQTSLIVKNIQRNTHGQVGNKYRNVMMHTSNEFNSQRSTDEINSSGYVFGKHKRNSIRNNYSSNNTHGQIGDSREQNYPHILNQGSRGNVRIKSAVPRKSFNSNEKRSGGFKTRKTIEMSQESINPNRESLGDPKYFHQHEKSQSDIKCDKEGMMVIEDQKSNEQPRTYIAINKEDASLSGFQIKNLQRKDQDIDDSKIRKQKRKIKSRNKKRRSKQIGQPQSNMSQKPLDQNSQIEGISLNQGKTFQDYVKQREMIMQLESQRKYIQQQQQQHQIYSKRNQKQNLTQSNKDILQQCMEIQRLESNVNNSQPIKNNDEQRQLKNFISAQIKSNDNLEVLPNKQGAGMSNLRSRLFNNIRESILHGASNDAQKQNMVQVDDGFNDRFMRQVQMQHQSYWSSFTKDKQLFNTKQQQEQLSHHSKTKSQEHDKNQNNFQTTPNNKLQKLNTTPLAINKNNKLGQTPVNVQLSQNQINHDAYTRDILQLIKNQQFQEYRFKKQGQSNTLFQKIENMIQQANTERKDKQKINQSINNSDQKQQIYTREMIKTLLDSNDISPSSKSNTIIQNISQSMRQLQKPSTINAQKPKSLAQYISQYDVLSNGSNSATNRGQILQAVSQQTTYSPLAQTPQIDQQEKSIGENKNGNLYFGYKKNSQKFEPVKKQLLVQKNKSQINNKSKQITPIKKEQQSSINNINPEYTHLKNHIINEVIRWANDFIIETFLKPNDQLPNFEKIKQICQFFQFKMPKNAYDQPSILKSKEFQIQSKERILQRLYETINKENDITDDQISKWQGTDAASVGSRKFYVGRGNNYPLVRQIFKQRWWWQLLPEEDFETANFIWTSWRKNELLEYLKPLKQKQNDALWSDGKLRIYNRLEDNFHLSNKKALFFNMCQYYKLIGRDPFSVLPLTFHIEHGLGDPEYSRFTQYFNQIEQNKQIRKKELETKKQKYQKESGKNEYDSESEIEDEEAFFNVKVPKNIWIMKPGENSNRGTGIVVYSTLREIQQEVTSVAKSGHTHIIQKYIERPLLINKRKFDIRVYGMMTSVNGLMKGYFYEDGYIRTSCKEFSLENLSNRFIHLTNDAVQKKSEDYGRFENGNKISYQNFQKYIETNFQQMNINFFRDILPQIKSIITDTFRATFIKLDPKRRLHSFEILGYDFMIDDDFRVYLIEANTNPCLELSCPLLARIIPQMLDSAFRLSVDPLFPPQDFQMARKNTLHEIMPLNKFELVFDERSEGQRLREILKNQEEMKLKIDVNDEVEEEDEEDEEDEERMNREMMRHGKTENEEEEEEEYSDHE